MPGPEKARGMDRRSLIKRGAAAGAAAWTAPLILESVLSPAGAQSAGPPPPPQPPAATGIRFVGASASRVTGSTTVVTPVTLTYGGTPMATTATSSPAAPSGNTRSYTASIQLIDQYGSPFVNAGGAISVAITRTGGTGGPTPTPLTIPSGANLSSTSTTITLPNGDFQAVLSAAATVNTVAVMATVSTTTTYP